MCTRRGEVICVRMFAFRSYHFEREAVKTCVRKIPWHFAGFRSFPGVIRNGLGVHVPSFSHSSYSYRGVWQVYGRCAEKGFDIASGWVKIRAATCRCQASSR